jgi:chorismate synthase
MSNTFGTLFRVTGFGESHGPCVGAVVDGCPSRLELSEADIQPQLDRRRPGQSRLTTKRGEKDRVRILSGVEKGVTLGSPLVLWVDNEDRRPEDYGEMRRAPRPSHADYTYLRKYGVLAGSGGGRASARETCGRVAAGAVAEKFLRTHHGVDIVAWVDSVSDIAAPDMTGGTVTRALVDAGPTRCPDVATAEAIAARIEQTAAEGDSLGGTVTCECRGVPAGWGEPVFDKLEALLGHAMLSIPATKGFEIGSGFAGTRMRGSEHNDRFEDAGEDADAAPGHLLRTVTNFSGGVQGGISNGQPIVFRVALKPVATIQKPQETVDFQGRPMVFEARGRHDPCVLPRAVPIVESMAALVLADAALMAS